MKKRYLNTKIPCTYLAKNVYLYEIIIESERMEKVFNFESEIRFLLQKSETELNSH